jgi:hypothetical protein
MNKYSIPQIENMLDSMVILYDSREQPTAALERRRDGFNRPSLRKALAYGDYSCLYTLPNGETQTLEKEIIIERKASLSEICTNFTAGRERFKREFERAVNDGAKTFIIIEDAGWENAYAGKYKSKLNPRSLVASLLAWSCKYNITIYFCKSETTGCLIADILHYALREKLIQE